MLAELTQLIAKEESTEGTAVALANAEANYLVRNVAFRIVRGNFERATKRASFSKFPSIPGSSMGEITFEMDMYGQASAAAEPHWSTILKACGLKATASGNAFVYTPSSVWNPTTMGSSDHKSLTMQVVVDGYARAIRGARGNAILRLKAGEPGVLVCRFMGVLTSPSDVALYSPTYATGSSTPPIWATATLSVGGLSAAEALVENLSIDFGNTIGMRPDANSADGYRSCAIGNRDARMTFDPEMLTIAQGFDFDQVWRLATTAALSTTWGATTQKFTVTAPAVQYVDQEHSERAPGLSVMQASCALRGSSGDDEFSLTIGSV
jgi:hypothetical protein